MFTKTGPTTGSMSGQATTTQGPTVEGKERQTKGRSPQTHTHTLYRVAGLFDQKYCIKYHNILP